MGPFAVASYSRPFGGEERGGDRFEVALHPEGKHLLYYLADAAGHGEMGAAFWEAHGARTSELWGELVVAKPGLEALRRFTTALNAHLNPEAHLCLTVGALSADGVLRFTTCGFGAHTVPIADGRAWWSEDPGHLFGLKLGWVDPPRWAVLPRARVENEVEGVTRVLLFSDGFLEDDHADPVGALERVGALGDASATESQAMVVARFQAIPHDHDDAALVVIDRPG